MQDAKGGGHSHGNSCNGGPGSPWHSRSVATAREMSTTFWDLI
jgi:hypothetical protein